MVAATKQAVCDKTSVFFQEFC